MSVHQEVFSEGFHGTSLSRVQSIERVGFRTDQGPICFATLGDREYAEENGIIAAQKDGENQFGIIHADFPPQAVELWPIPRQIRVPAEQAGSIVVKSVLIFNMSLNGLFVPSESGTKVL